MEVLNTPSGRHLVGQQADSTRGGTNRVKRFLARHVAQIRAGGMHVLLAKMYQLFKLFLAMPLVVVVWLLRPLVVIRFGPLFSSRIGHFAANTELFLCERDAGMRGKHTFDVFYHQPRVCNQQLKKMWDRTLRVHAFARWPGTVISWLPGGQVHSLPFGLRSNLDRDHHGLLARTSPHLDFTSEEERAGWQGLSEMGISRGSPFICLHARDSEYLANARPDVDTRYHNYRDSTISKYVPAAEKLACRGYFVVRMGARVKDRLAGTTPRVIDYATNGHRTDFMDIFLGARCAFFISSGTGIDAIPVIFRRPTMFVNFVPLEYGRYWEPTHVFIPKKHWLGDEHRFLAFREILDLGIGRFLRTEQFERLGIELVENTPEEITAVAIEMDERLKGTWQTTEEDEELQRRFKALLKPSELNQVFRSRIGAKFLRQNRDLLD